MQSKERGFVKLPLKLLTDQRITDRAKVLGAILIDLAAADGAVEQATCDEIAELMGCNERTVRRAEEELCSAGYIHVRRTGRASRIWLTPAIRTGNGWSALRWAQRDPEREKGAGVV